MFFGLFGKKKSTSQNQMTSKNAITNPLKNESEEIIESSFEKKPEQIIIKSNSAAANTRKEKNGCADIFLRED